MEPAYERLMQLVTEARKRRQLERPVDLIKASGMSKTTVHRLETGQPLGESSLRKLSRALGWTPDSASDVLAGGEPTEAEVTEKPESDLEVRYRRQPVEPGLSTQVVEDMVYKVLVVAAPDTPLSKIDEARRAAFDVLRSNNIEVARRHPEESQGTATGP